MIKLAVRDDDLNFFSKVEDIEYVFSSVKGVPISYAVVPMITDVLGGCPETAGNKTPRWIGDNIELVEYLKGKLDHKEAEILLHGITHEYKIINNVQCAEMIWRENDEDLTETIGYYKAKLEEVFRTKISTFVAPCNHISKKCLHAVAINNLDYSGIVPLRFQRDVTLKNILSYLKRFRIRLLKGIPFPGVLEYSDHLEINACAIPDRKYLDKIYNYCVDYDLPIVLNTHYWNLRDNEDRRNLFNTFVNECLDRGAIPSTLEECKL